MTTDQKLNDDVEIIQLIQSDMDKTEVAKEIQRIATEKYYTPENGWERVVCFYNETDNSFGVLKKRKANANSTEPIFVSYDGLKKYLGIDKDGEVTLVYSTEQIPEDTLNQYLNRNIDPDKYRVLPNNVNGNEKEPLGESRQY